MRNYLKIILNKLKLPLFIAKRYLFAKKTHNLINILSIISVIGVFVGTLSLIVILSVMNGFEELITDMYNTFNPDLKITALKGKTINVNDFPYNKILRIKGIQCFSHTIEENALIRYKNKQQIVIVKGVDNNFRKVNQIESKIVEGSYFHSNKSNFMVLGYGIYDILEVKLNDLKNKISVYIPKRGKISNLNPLETFNNEQISPIGAFSIQQDFDTKYVLVPIKFMQELMDYDDEFTSIEIKVNDLKNIEKIKREIEEIISNKYEIKDRYQQEELLYKVIKSEKLAIFLILAFVILIATFNIVTSLSMLIMEKTSDINILRSLGVNKLIIKLIFINEGLLISLIGAFGGIVAGGILSWLQQNYGFIKLQGSGTFIINSYPAKIQISDFIYVFIIVLIFGILASWIPVSQIRKKILNKIEVSDL